MHFEDDQVIADPTILDEVKSVLEPKKKKQHWKIYIPELLCRAYHSWGKVAAERFEDEESVGLIRIAPPQVVGMCATYEAYAHGKLLVGVWAHCHGHSMEVLAMLMKSVDHALGCEGS